MRPRDEVLREFGISAAQFAGDYEMKMADRRRAERMERVVDLLRIVSVLPSPDLLTDGDWADLCDAVRALTAAEGGE